MRCSGNLRRNLFASSAICCDSDGSSDKPVNSSAIRIQRTDTIIPHKRRGCSEARLQTQGREASPRGLYLLINIWKQSHPLKLSFFTFFFLEGWCKMFICMTIKDYETKGGEWRGESDIPSPSRLAHQTLKQLDAVFIPWNDLLTFEKLFYDPPTCNRDNCHFAFNVEKLQSGAQWVLEKCNFNQGLKVIFKHHYLIWIFVSCYPTLKKTDTRYVMIFQWYITQLGTDAATSKLFD